MRKQLGAALLTAAVSGCASNNSGTWIRPDYEPQKFAQDRFECMQASRRPEHNAYVNAYGGGSYGTVVVDPQMFGACMMAKGYSWRPDKQ